MISEAVKAAAKGETEKLFVYGIFLGERMRRSFGMDNPQYATVQGFATKGHHIVAAVRDPNYTLTGLLVDVPISKWHMLDALEGGYDRIKVATTNSVDCYMYLGRN